MIFHCIRVFFNYVPFNLHSILLCHLCHRCVLQSHFFSFAFITMSSASTGVVRSQNTTVPMMHTPGRETRNWSRLPPVSTFRQPHASPSIPVGNCGAAVLSPQQMYIMTTLQNAFPQKSTMLSPGSVLQTPPREASRAAPHPAAGHNHDGNYGWCISE